MFIMFATIKVKGEYKEAFLEEMRIDADSSIQKESGCLRLDILQNLGDSNTFHLYEVYEDKSAFSDHLKTNHYLRWKEKTGPWCEIVSVECENLFPSDESNQWKK